MHQCREQNTILNFDTAWFFFMISLETHVATCLLGVPCVQLNRKDLTYLKVYAIDVDEADEVIFTKVV